MDAVEDAITELVALMRPVLRDGLRKRGVPTWRSDPTHRAAMMRHIARDASGERQDPDSGAHPLAHAGVRALMAAWQETQA